MQTAEDIDQSLPKPKKSRKGIGGRPSKYNPELIMKSLEYLDTYQEKGHTIPTSAGLCLAIGISKETCNQWEKDKNKSQFSEVCRRIRLIQEQSLLDKGLEGTWNSNIAKLVLSKHGYTDNPQGNQGPAGITVQVNRGSVKLKSGGQELEIDTTEDTGRTIEHKP